MTTEYGWLLCPYKCTLLYGDHRLLKPTTVPCYPNTYLMQSPGYQYSVRENKRTYCFPRMLK